MSTIASRVAVLLLAAGAVVALGLWTLRPRRPALADLPMAPTVSYADAGPAAPTNLAADVRRMGSNVVDSYAAWQVLAEQSAGEISPSNAVHQLMSMQAAMRVDLRDARYVLLSDRSPALPIGFITRLPILRRYPVWLVPTSSGQGSSALQTHDYLVVDAHSGTLLEHLHIVSIDPFATCPAGDTLSAQIGRLLCLLSHANDARSVAYRSAA